MTASSTAASCWICGDPADSREHRTKRSDLKLLFGTPSQQRPLFLHTDTTRNRRVGSLDATKLKWTVPICSHCNNVRTQVHDMAWSALSTALLFKTPPIKPGMIIRADRIFRTNTSASMLGVHLYFAKLFGCGLAEAGFPMPADMFAQAILHERHCPHLYLKFACTNDRSEHLMASGSNLHIAHDSVTHDPRFAAIIHHVGRLKVLVMFAAPGAEHDGLIAAWHPKFGTNRLELFDLGD